MGAAAVQAVAGPLDKGRLDAAARWVVHVDVEAVMRSTTGSFIAEHRTELDLAPLEEFKARTGLDAFRDILDVTIYGTTDSSEDAVVIVRGTASLESAVEEVMKGMPKVERPKIGNRDGYRWLENGTERFGCLLGSADQGPRQFIVSREKARLEQALRVLGQESPSLRSEDDCPMAADPKPGSMVFIAAADMTAAMANAPRMLRGVKSIRIDMGEDSEGMYGDAVLHTSNESDARTITDFGRGVLAVGRMARSGDLEMKGLSRALDGVKLDVEGPELRVSIRISHEYLRAALSDLKAEAQALKKDGPAIERTSQENKR
jgi:hypothetical protein